MLHLDVVKRTVIICVDDRSADRIIDVVIQCLCSFLDRCPSQPCKMRVSSGPLGM